MTLADRISMLRACAVVPIAILLAAHDQIAALAVFALAALTDAADGAVARHRHEETDRGAALDPLADKILVVGTLAALVVAGAAPIAAFAVILARELAAVWLRAQSARPLAATADAKLKTVAQAVAAALLIAAAARANPALVLVATAALWAAVALTAASGVRLFLRATQTIADAR